MMANYTIEEKEKFTVLAIGTELKSDYKDHAGLVREKEEFWREITEDGRLEKLKTIAVNDYLFAINEAYDNKMMYYAGVISEKSIPIPEVDRSIDFPEGEYVVVKGEERTFEELNNNLTNITFGEVFSEAKEVEYIGGPNAVVVMGQRKGMLYGEMWIPVIRKHE